MKIRLFSTFYPEKDPARLAEYLACLSENLGNEAIDEVLLLVEGEPPGLPESPKLTCRKIASRPSYDDFFSWMREMVGPDDLSILANTDIYFGKEAAVLRRIPPDAGEAWALSRWDLGPGNSSDLFERADSQDTWMLRGVPLAIDGSFSLGVARCDNRIAAELARAGYRVRNPSFSLRTYHLHAGDQRDYTKEVYTRSIPPPYLYVWPENLLCWPRVLAHNLKHPGERLDYRFDSRRWSPRRPLVHARKKLGALRRKILGRSVVS